MMPTAKTEERIHNKTPKREWDRKEHKWKKEEMEFATLASVDGSRSQEPPGSFSESP